ncbi:MAG: hypothetical protein R6V17_07370 [Halanaerobacter sp.]
MSDTINDIVDNIESIINNNYTINHSNRTRLNLFIPEDYPAICYQVENLGESGEQLRSQRKDRGFGISLFYIEKAEVNENQYDFIDKVENIIELLRESGDLNSRVFSLLIEADLKDRGTEDNAEFIAQIKIEGLQPR